MAKYELRFLSLEEQLKTISAQLNLLADIPRKFDILNAMVTSFSSRLSALEDKVIKCVDLKKELDFTKAEIYSLKTSYSKVRQELEAIQTEAFGKDIEISGYQGRPTLTPFEIVTKLGSLAGVDIKTEDIAKCEHAQRATDRFVTVVSFKNTDLRNALLTCGKKCRPKTDFVDGKHKPLYVNERLSNYTRSLFYKVKLEKVKRGWKYLWTKNRQILLKMEQEGRITRIKTEEDLINLVK